LFAGSLRWTIWSLHWFTTFSTFNPSAWFPWIGSRRLFLMTNTKNMKIKSRTWYSLTQEAFFEYMYKVTFQNLIWNLFLRQFQCFPNFILVEGTPDSYGHCPSIVLCKSPKPCYSWPESVAIRPWRTSKRSTWQHFTRNSLFVTHHLDQSLFNKYKFITIWIHILKWWQKNYNSLCPLEWVTSRKFFGSNRGINP